MIEACPACHLPVLPNASEFVRQTGAVCRCDMPQTPLHATETRPAAVPGVSGRHETEEQVQRAILDALASLGLEVLQTTVRYRPCPRCGHLDHRGYGAHPAVPDLLVCVGGGVLKGLEVKGPKTPVSEAQRRLAVAGHITIVRSVAEAVDAVS